MNTERIDMNPEELPAAEPFEVLPGELEQAPVQENKPQSGRFKNNSNKIRQSKFDIALGIINIIFLVLGVIIICFPLLNYFSLAFNNGYFNLDVVIFPVKPTFAAMKYVLFETGAAEFWTAFGNSVIITITVTIGSNLMMALAAYALSKKDFPLRSTLLMYFVITMLFSTGIVPIYLLMSAFKLTNTIFSVILISLSNVANMLYFKTFFEGISQDIEDASKLDGANNLQLFFLIIVPMSLPIVGTCCFFTVVSSWNSYGAAMMFIANSEKSAQPLAYYLYLMIENGKNIKGDAWRMANWKNVEAASMLASIIPIIAMYPFIVKYIRGGLQLGSVKG